MGNRLMGEMLDIPLERGMQAELEFSVRWESEEARHEERFLARKVDFCRDILPPGMDVELAGARSGQVVSGRYIPGKLVPGYRPRKVAVLDRDCFRKFKIGGHLLEPQAGRFYPLQMLHSHPGIRIDDVRPAFRVLDALTRALSEAE